MTHPDDDAEEERVVFEYCMADSRFTIVKTPDDRFLMRENMSEDQTEVFEEEFCSPRLITIIKRIYGNR